MQLSFNTPFKAVSTLLTPWPAVLPCSPVNSLPVVNPPALLLPCLFPLCSPAITLPLGAIFGPVDLLLKKLPPAQARQLAALPVVGAGFVPPVAVEQVAKVAVAAATDASVPGGVIDDWQIRDWV